MIISQTESKDYRLYDTVHFAIIYLIMFTLIVELFSLFNDMSFIIEIISYSIGYL